MVERAWAHYEDVPLDDSFEYGDRYGISDVFGSEQMRFSVIRFDPGERGPHHYHNWEEEYYLVLEGELEVTIGDETTTATAGMVLYTPPGTPHYPENRTDDPAVLLSVTAPMRDSADEDRIVVIDDPA